MSKLGSDAGLAKFLAWTVLQAGQLQASSASKSWNPAHDDIETLPFLELRRRATVQALASQMQVQRQVFMEAANGRAGALAPVAAGSKLHGGGGLAGYRM